MNGLKFRLKKGKGSVGRFTAADGTKYKPGDVVELPSSYRGERWLEVVEPVKIEKPMQKVDVSKEQVEVPLPTKGKKKKGS